MAEASSVKIEAVRERETYRVGEPIAVRYSIQNVSDRELQFAIEYPAHMGVHFHCADPDAKVVVNPRIGGRIPILKLQPREAYARLVALNRYMTLARSKKFTVEYAATYVQSGEAAGRNPLQYSGAGQFDITIEDGPLERARLENYRADVDGQDPVTAEQAVEMLLWANDPMVIAPLVQGAARFPSTGRDVVGALERFVPSPEARDAILTVGRDGDANALVATLDVCDKHGIEVPVEFFKSVLASGYTGKLHATLTYLLEHGDSRHIPFIKPYETYHNPEIQKLAKECVKTLSRK